MRCFICTGRFQSRWIDLRIGVFSIVLLALTVMGCIAFRGGMLAPLPAAHGNLAPGAPHLGYRVTVLFDGEPAVPKTVSWATTKIHAEFESSGVFAAVPITNGQRFVLDIIVQESCSSAVRTVTGVLATFTLAVLPLYSPCAFELQAILLRNGLEIKRYRFHDYETDVGWLFFALVQPFVDARWGSTIENLTRHLVRQLVSDGLIRL
jgi:hypothetical protein